MNYYIKRVAGWLFCACLAAGVLSACGGKSYLSSESVSDSDVEVMADADEEASQEDSVDISTTIFVQVTGAVAKPGVYEVPGDARLFQVVEQAGGLLSDAAPDSINQAGIVTDGQSVHIPTVEEQIASSQNGTGQGGISADGRVNINTATAADLMTLSGIGQSKADAIIEYRDTNGTYSTIEDIKNIPGIKDGVFNKIKDDITVGN